MHAMQPSACLTHGVHAWGLSCKLPETLRVPPHTVPCEHSIALTSRQIGHWGFLGTVCSVLPIRSCVSGRTGSICEHSRRSCADVSLVSGTPCAHGLTRLLCDPDRIVHTPLPIPPSRVHTASILFGRRCYRAQETRLITCEHRPTRMLQGPKRTVHTSSRPRPHTFVVAVHTFVGFLRQTQGPSISSCSFGTWAVSGPSSAIVLLLVSESALTA